VPPAALAGGMAVVSVAVHVAATRARPAAATAEEE
jgi:hypothetical protein